MKCQSLFSVKNKKNIPKYGLLKLLPSMLVVNKLTKLFISLISILLLLA